MIKRTLKQIHQMIGGLNTITEWESVCIAGVSIDSRKVTANHLFVPLQGEQVNGHHYVEKAFEQGATASLWQKNVPNPPENVPIILVEDTEVALQELARAYRQQLNVKVIGVTGSNGKTTTKDMIAALLATTYKVHKTSGNYNNHLGLPLTILSMSEETEVAVLEMGMSSRGEIEFLSKLACPDMAIITNIGESHLLDLGSREEIANAKLEIIEGLVEDGILIYFGDEPLLSDKVGNLHGSIQVLSFGRSNTNDIYATSIQQRTDGTSYTAKGILEGSFEIPVLGQHNVMNALAAMLVAKELQVDQGKMQEGLASVRLTNMRLEMVEGANGENIINDAYNASPTSMMAAIELIEGLIGFHHKILVLGDMLELGIQEQDFHLKIGEHISSEKIDKVFTYGPLAENIAIGARKTFAARDVFSFQDKSQLIEELKKHIEPNDLILVKASRGMRLEEIVQALQK